MDEQLEDQIKQEKAEIENAPKVPIAELRSNMVGRCSFCGQLTRILEYVDSMHGIERYRGECCGARPSR